MYLDKFYALSDTVQVPANTEHHIHIGSYGEGIKRSLYIQTSETITIACQDSQGNLLESRDLVTERTNCVFIPKDCQVIELPSNLNAYTVTYKVE